MTKRKKCIEIYDCRAGKIVSHKKKKVDVNHNRELAFPDLEEKGIQGKGEENCIALALASCLKALRSRNAKADVQETWENIVSDANNFHNIVLQSFPDQRYDECITILLRTHVAILSFTNWLSSP